MMEEKDEMQNQKEGKDQESIQLGTTPDPTYKRAKRSARSQQVNISEYKAA